MKRMSYRWLLLRYMLAGGCSITSVNADAAWNDGDTNIEIVGTDLI